MYPTTNSVSSSSSDMSLPNSEGSHWMSICNEEMRLAATTPKKRAGRKKFKETRHPVYRGVRKRNLDKWVCEMREPNKKTKIWLGTFPTAEMAARAHDVAAMALRGRYACLNFADSAWRLPKPATTQAKDIQKAATEAAEAFRPDKTLLTNHNDNDNDNDKENDMAVVATATEEQSMICMEEKEEGVMNMQEMWSNMALMSPTHSLGYYEYQYINEDFQDEEVSLWSF
ncbi:putative transcription factor AP2-EREBP family [Medicago truncatula]|uniref:C-repeat binding factor 3 n=1 Tax=Medicago truncatula TaxID=3880 RepID=Q2XQA6_MEDTR|nr:dehydration-responsive element-binding protein 1A [Medicago truncatula]ABB72792.1 dehydration responsive element binding protein [Medicago truncatula]ABX80064.1 CRT/DRE binding factor 3 [Medicago truncatula]AGR40676.1 C-repeat binding factor 3 [Medicago truncatula]RHN51861.1 putative transcription factor AP2-EREBP family [Medicago truncatula]